MEQGYANLYFPFQQIEIDPVPLRESWNVYQLLGYISTWPIVKQAEKVL